MMDYKDIIIIFIILCLIAWCGFIISLNLFAFNKKIFWIYKNQIDEYGEIIKKPTFWQLHFDILIVGYIFYSMPAENENLNIYRIKKMKTLKKHIIFFSTALKISLALTIFFVAMLIILIQGV